MFSPWTPPVDFFIFCCSSRFFNFLFLTGSIATPSSRAVRDDKSSIPRGGAPLDTSLHFYHALVSALPVLYKSLILKPARCRRMLKTHAFALAA